MMENSLIKAFLPDGVVGKDGIGINCLKTNISAIYNIFNSFAKRTLSSSGVIYPYELDRFTVHKRKISFFRPTDVIYTCDLIISSKRTIKKADYYIGGLYSLFVSCGSFTLDTSLIGTDDINEINERIFFVIPDGKTKLVKNIASFTSGLRKCGVVTSDGMIRFIKNGVSDEFNISSLPSLPPATLEIKTPYDFNMGCLDAFAQCLKSRSLCRFPYKTQNSECSDRFSYKLGYLAVSSRENSDTIPAYYAETPVNCAGFFVSVIPIFSNNGIFPFDNAFAFVPYLEAEAKKRSFFAYTAVSGDLLNYVNQFGIMTHNKTAMPMSDCGYIIIVSDTPTPHSQIGFMMG